MSALVIAILMPIFAAVDQPGNGEVYEITPVSGGESYFATIDDTTKDTLVLRRYYGAGSGLGGLEMVKKSAIKYGPVGAATANKTIESRKNQSTQIVNGERYPISEVERAKEARQKALALESRFAMPEPQAVEPGVETASEPINPGPLAFRGPQIGLVLAAIVLIAIIVKLVIIG